MSTDAASTPEGEKLIGEIFANRYQIECKLGEGAMGAVYKARHVKVGRPFAVKVLHSKLLEDNKVALRFEREAELAGRLRHPNVVGVVDVGETPDGLRYMVMDFAEGEDLAALLSEAPMPPPRVINLTRQMLEGLYHAHEQGLIHRDFKPENVIIEKDAYGVEVPRIVDFGIAILREGGESSSAEGRLTTNGLVLGTPHYMAPEQAVADPIDHRIDLFAVGIVVYEMLSGKLPFDGSGAEVARANLLLDPPVISQRVPYLEVDPLLEAFARRLMAKKRDMRPATAKAARELLDLISSDRAAAAAALGVPLQSARTQAVTEDVAPQQRAVSEDGPVDYAAQDPVATASSLEAPPVSGRVAVAQGSRVSAQRGVATDVANPLEFGDELPRSPVRKWLFAGIGLVAAGGVAAFALSRGGDQDAVTTPHGESTKVAIESPPPVPTPTPTPTPAEPVTPTVVAPADTPTPDITTPDPQPVPKPTGTKVTKPTVKPTIKPATTKPDTTIADVDKTVDKTTTTPVVTPPATKPDDPTDETSDRAAFSAQYKAIGTKLAALGPAASELWPRYRMIKFSDALISAPKRAEAKKVLSRLAQDIAALPK